MKRGDERAASALPRLLRVIEVAELCSVAPDTVRRWVTSGQLDAFELGADPQGKRRDLRIEATSLHHFLNARRVHAATPATTGSPRKQKQSPKRYRVAL